MTDIVRLARLRALLQDDHVVMDCLAMLKVACEKGDRATEAMRKALATFVLVAAREIETSPRPEN